MNQRMIVTGLITLLLTTGCTPEMMNAMVRASSQYQQPSYYSHQPSYNTGQSYRYNSPAMQQAQRELNRVSNQIKHIQNGSYQPTYSYYAGSTPCARSGRTNCAVQ